jgi:hypothetical protein
LYAELDGKRLAIEVELGVRRVVHDVRKAEALGLDTLIVVTPTPKVAALARRRVRTQTQSRVRVHVLPFGRAIVFLSQVFGVDSQQDTKSESGSPTTTSSTETVG